MLNVGILGFGYMGEIRFNYFDANPHFTVKKIFHLEKITGNFIYVQSMEEIIMDPRIDCVVVCLPNFLSKDAVVKSLSAGKHVFCEKPPGISVQQVSEMIRTEQESKKKLKFGFNHRYHPSVLKAKELLETGRFGEVLWLRGCYGKNGDPVGFNHNWRSKPELAGGGILLDQGIHMLDLIIDFCNDFNQVKAFTSSFAFGNKVEDNALIILKNAKGQMASLHSTMSQWQPVFNLELALENGYLSINGLLSKSGRYGPESITYALQKGPESSAATTIQYNNDCSWQLEVEEFATAIMEDKAISIGNTTDALKLMALVEKIYQNAVR
jgi:1,5-anhydro-D-fructose reductase (1,5-anhydro-D-mannitol-forming)